MPYPHISDFEVGRNCNSFLLVGPANGSIVNSTHFDSSFVFRKDRDIAYAYLSSGVHKPLNHYGVRTPLSCVLEWMSTRILDELAFEPTVEIQGNIPCDSLGQNKKTEVTCTFDNQRRLLMRFEIEPKYSKKIDKAIAYFLSKHSNGHIKLEMIGDGSSKFAQTPSRWLLPFSIDKAQYSYVEERAQEGFLKEDEEEQKSSFSEKWQTPLSWCITEEK